MLGIVWWEVETAEPERFQTFHAALTGWTFEPAFEDTELGARLALGDDDRWFGVIRDPAGVSFGLWTSRPNVR